jgi:hypothetical protein
VICRTSFPADRGVTGAAVSIWAFLYEVADDALGTRRVRRLRTAVEDLELWNEEPSSS